MTITPSSNSSNFTNSNGNYPIASRNGVGYPNSSSGYPVPTNGLGSDANQLDLWGAILRRKFVVILASMIGAGLGYLHYLKTPEKYRSEIKLSVTSQAPPKIINGDTFVQKVSMPLHKNLIASQLVVGKAIEQGDLLQTELLQGELSPVNKLRGLLKVQTVDKSDELMLLSLTGPDADELPKILKFVVDAYEEVVTQENKAVGQEAADLMEKLQKQFVDTQDKAGMRYLELMRGIGADRTGEDGKTIINPYAPEVERLTEERNLNRQELMTVTDKISWALKASESADEMQLKVLATEARKHFSLTYDEVRKSNESKRIDAMTADIKMYERRIEELREQLVEFGLARDELSEVYGPGHAKLKNMMERLKYTRSELANAEKQKGELMSALDSLEDPKSKHSIDWGTIEAKTELQWIKMYVLALQRDSIRLSNAATLISDELEKAQIAAQKVSGDVAEIRLLDEQIRGRGEAISVILDRLSEMNLLSQDYETTRVRVLDEPGLGYQIDPIIWKSLGIGILLTSLLGVGLALLIDRADLSFHNPTEIFTRVDVPVVGRLPRLKLTPAKSGELIGSSSLVAANHPNSAGSESFRTIRTHLFYDIATNGTKTIMITSPSPGDGKSTVACNLAISIAQTGKRVALVDADLRRPRVHQHFGISDKVGLMNVLKGETTLKEALQPTFLRNLFVLPCGHRPKNPGEVVTSENFAKVIELLRSGFDIVILDTPPVIPVADPVSIASLVDGVYLVFRIRRGVKITASRAKESLSQVNARLLGVIVNGLDENPHYNDYGGYSQYPLYGNYGRLYQERIQNEYKEDEPESVEVKI
jgi:capsular exopolysaccharide synthesis family protein